MELNAGVFVYVKQVKYNNVEYLYKSYQHLGKFGKPENTSFYTNFYQFQLNSTRTRSLCVREFTGWSVHSFPFP